MANVLHRKKSVGALEVLPSAPDFVPESLLPSGPDGDSPAPWPTGAKVAVAALAVMAVVATIGAVIGFAAGDDGTTERELRSEIESLTVDRDQAIATAGVFEADIAALREDLTDIQAVNADLDAAIAELQNDLTAAEDVNVDLNADIAGLGSQVDALTEEVAASVAAVDEANAARGAAVARADNLAAALVTERDRLAATVTERDALTALFPMKLTGSIADVEVVGKHDVQLTPVYCSGLASCSTAPSQSELAIRRTTDGFLRVDWAGTVDVGLTQAAGALHAVAESTTAVPTCDGSPRTANVTMAMFPSRSEIAAGGDRTIVSVTALLTIEAPALGNCPAAHALYSTEFTPKA